MDEVKSLLEKILTLLQQGTSKLQRWLSRSWRRFMRNFTKFIDPKLNRYRTTKLPQPSPNHQKTKQPNSQPSPDTASVSSTDNLTDHQQPPAPASTDELLELLKRTPTSVLNEVERQNIIAAINFPILHVSKLMLPRAEITYVKENETLGPLVLDQLYRSGFQHFPVVDSKNQIIGLIHTTALNHLDTKTTQTAKDILDPTMYYLRSDYTLSQALAAFLRTNCFFFLVVDSHERIVGLLTYQMLIQFLLGTVPEDNFEHDTDRQAVAHRSIKSASVLD